MFSLKSELRRGAARNRAFALQVLATRGAAQVKLIRSRFRPDVMSLAAARARAARIAAMPAATLRCGGMTYGATFFASSGFEPLY